MSQAGRNFRNSGPGPFIDRLVGDVGFAVPNVAGDINTIGGATSVFTNINTFGDNLNTMEFRLNDSIQLPNTNASGSEGVYALGAGTLEDARFMHNFGTESTFLGFRAGNLTNTGLRNTGIGHQALINISTGDNNTAIGRAALQTLTGGNNSTAVGYNALVASLGSPNTAVGASALSANTTGSENTVMGVQAGISNTSGDRNVFIGHSTASFNQDGTQNIAIGAGALNENVSGDNNVCIGEQAGQKILQNQNVCIGSFALELNTGANCVAIGYRAAQAGNNESNVTAVGTQACESITTSNHVAFGYQALQSVTSGLRNTAIGYQALQDVVTGTGNTAVGNQALLNATGSNNTALGDLCGDAIASGAGNTLLGKSSGSAITTGASNIALGLNAGNTITTTSNNIDIGNTGTAGDSGKIRIGTDGTHTTCHITGIEGVSITPTEMVVIDGSDQLGGITYASGTFTPGLRFGGASTGISYGVQAGSYYRIGNFVHFSIRITLTSKGTAIGVADVTNLPITSSASEPIASINIRIGAAVSFADYPQAAIPTSNTRIVLGEVSNAGVQTRLDDTNFADNSDITLTGMYLAA